MSGVGTGLNKSKKRNQKRRWTVRLLLIIFILLLTLAGAMLSYNYVTNSSAEQQKEEKIEITPGKEIYVDIPRGSNVAAIAELLKEEGLVKNTFVFQMLSKINGYDGLYQSGTHIVSAELDYDQLMRVLTSKPESRRVTLPEGYTYKQIVSALIKNNVISSKEEFDRAAAGGSYKYKFLEGLPSRENPLEGYLFPDTYEFGMNASPEDVINLMLRNFNSKFEEEYYEQAKKLDMTVDEVIILASIVEREAKVEEERDLIAGVFYNRLKSKDQSLKKLQSCATIQYIFLNKDGTVKERITEADTQINDPYNTYMIEGLPPGPISCPGEAAIMAALYPDTEEGYLYFVSKGDGTHQFSKTFKEHQEAIKKYGEFN